MSNNNRWLTVPRRPSGDGQGNPYFVTGQAKTAQPLERLIEEHHAAVEDARHGGPTVIDIYKNIERGPGGGAGADHRGLV